MHNIPRNFNLDEKKKLAREQTRLKYKKLKESLLQCYSNNDYDAANLKDISTLLHISPDFYTLWNYRKKILVSQMEGKNAEEKLNILKGELTLTESLLKRDIKSYPTWHHRRWIMILLNDPNAWKKELQQILIVLKYDLRNFHCWNYRRYILGLLGYDPRDELNFLEALFEDNPSNYSAWHNRSFMLNKIKEKHDIKNLIQEEFEWCKQGFYTDPSDSSAWIYHRWLLSTKEGEELGLIEQDDDLCNELSEMAMEEDDPKERDAQLKWPHLTHVLNVIELKKSVHVDNEAIYKEFELLRKVDPMREKFYQDRRSDFIILQTELSLDQKFIASGQSITRFDSLQYVSGVEIADFSNNKIRQLSVHMKELPNLHTLLLNNNDIKYLEGIKQFQALKHLEIRDNKIEFIGSEVILNDSLEYLDLRGNKLKDPTYGTLEYLKTSFPSLKTVLFD